MSISVLVVVRVPEVCPTEVFDVVGEQAQVARPDDCTECETCVDNCPEEAISMVE